MSRREFARLCGVLGTGLAASPLLAACGSSAEVEPGGGEPPRGGPEVEAGKSIAEVSRIATRTAVPLTDADSGEQAVLVRLEGGEFAAYSAACTHQGCIVAYEAEEGVLECPCHDSIFDPENGAEVVSGPASRPLPKIPVRIQGGSVARV